MTYNEYANLFLEGSEIPCVYQLMSGPSWGFRSWRSMLVQPWLEGQTMESINYLTPHLLSQDATYLEYYAPQVQMTKNYVFITHYISTQNQEYVSRYSVEDYSECGLYNPDSDYPTGRMFVQSVVYNENILYTLEYDWGVDYDNMQIVKVTFAEDNSTTREVIFVFEEYPYANGVDEYVAWDSYFFGHMKNGDNDCVISIHTFLGGENPEYYFKVIVHHINTGVTTAQWILPLDDPYGTDIYGIYWQATSPAFYQSKLMFQYIVDIDNMPRSPVYPYPLLEPFGSHCQNPIFILDISDDSVEIVQDHKTDFDTDWAYVDSWDATTIIDHNTNKMYWIGYYSSEYWETNGLDGQFIYEMNIYTPHNVTIVAMCPSTSMQTYQGPTTGYELNLASSGQEYNILSIPYQSGITTVGVTTPYGAAHNESGAIICIEKNGNILWNIGLDRLEGKSLVGGENRNIMINWEDSIIPYMFPSYEYKEVWLQILNGMAIVMVYSGDFDVSPRILQQDFYLLKETSSYTLPTISFSSNGTSVYFDFTFSDTSQMSVDWGDGAPEESNITHLEHTFGSSATRTITLTCPDFSKLASFVSDNAGFIGTLPNFQICSSLVTWEMHDNNFTSTLPYFGDCSGLVTFDCHNNNLSGELLFFYRCKNLISFNCSNNNFTDNHNNRFDPGFPDFDQNSGQLITFDASNNNFTNYGVYSFYRAWELTMINFENNNFTQDAVDGLLWELTLGIKDHTSHYGPHPICTVKLQGPNMAAPSTEGYKDKAELIALGWTVLTN
jgi:hypothetical protein